MRGLLLIVILGVITMVGAVLANWIPRPATMRTRGVLAGLAAVVLVSAVLGLLADGGRPVFDRRPLSAWVSDVNERCAAARPQAQAAGERNEIADSLPERVSALQELEDAHADLHEDVDALELPSDSDDREKAKDWLDVNGARLDRLTNFVDVMQELPANPNALDANLVGQASQAYAEATATARRKDEDLGISCP
jgi:hypothetical protein